MIRPWAVLGVPLALAWACAGGVLGAGPQWWFVAVGVVLFVGPMLVAEVESYYRRRIREEWQLGYSCGRQSATLEAEARERRTWPTFEFDLPAWRDPNGFGDDLEAPEWVTQEPKKTVVKTLIGHLSVWDGYRFRDASDVGQPVTRRVI